MTLKEYLAFEERSPIKHEYVGGEVHAMSGVTTRHNLITLNIARHLHAAAGRRHCKIFATDVKLQAAADRIYYPDIIIACGKAANVELIVEQPSLIVEVTSPSTRATDRREKLDAYQRIASLRQYLIVDQRRRHIFVYRRRPRGEWRRDEVSGDGRISVPVLGTRISLDDAYEGVDLPPLTVREGEDWEQWWDDAEESAEPLAGARERR